MECKVFIEEELIGTATFEIIDEPIGAINGKLIVSTKYKKYSRIIQKQTDEKGISNSENYNFKIVTKNNVIIKAEGGIGISDFTEFHEIIVETSGIDLSIFEK